MMKIFCTSLVVAASTLVAAAQEKKNRLLEFFDVNKAVEAEFVRVESDPSMEPYSKLLEEAHKKDPKWFAEHKKTGKPGSPIPFHEKLMSKEQYDAYLKTWDLRKIVPVKGKNGKPIRLKILVTKEGDDKYIINVPDVPLSVMPYSAGTDAFASSFGELKFFEEVEAPPVSSLRAWSGYEWKSVKKDTYVETKQLVGLGRTKDNKYGYLMYRMFQLADDKIVSDQRLVLRFAPVKKPKK